MAAIQRSYSFSKMFIQSGLYDTIKLMGGKVIASHQEKGVLESRLTILGSGNDYRFTIRPLPFGCLLQVISLNPNDSLSKETEERLLTVIIATLDQIIEDAFKRHGPHS